MDVVISGSSGLIGSALVRELATAGHHPIRLVRGTPKRDEIGWDPVAGTIDRDALEGVDGVVHLAGAGIGDHRWTRAYKAELVRSRTVATVVLAGALAQLDRKPSVLVSGSAIGYYGDRGDEELTETSPPGHDFLADLCVAWESATVLAEQAGVRVAHVRTGIVLSGKGGALKKQLPLFRLGLGGRFGKGDQWQSWISIDDEVGAIIHLLTNDVRGPVNATAPNPVTNAAFAKALANQLHRPSFLPVPSFGPKLILGGELAESVLFGSQRVTPSVLQASGYKFQHERLEDALESVLG
jgi:uncharacterized protein (TIGR01777 family)